MADAVGTSVAVPPSERHAAVPSDSTSNSSSRPWRRCSSRASGGSPVIARTAGVNIYYKFCRECGKPSPKEKAVEAAAAAAAAAAPAAEREEIQNCPYCGESLADREEPSFRVLLRS